MAGHKGYGLAVFVEILTAVLTGSAMMSSVHSWVSDDPEPSDQGHAFIAIDVGAIMPGAEFHQRIGAMSEEIAGAEMAPWGSARPVLGTNPWGIAVPRGEGRDPIVLDMALTQSGKGMMRWLQRAGLAMPDHWALTPDGTRTTDPAAAMDGPLLPIGDYKGYGLSLVTDILTGVLTGSLFGGQVFQDDLDYDVAHTMIAIDTDAFMPRPVFEERLEALVAEVLAAPPVDPDRPVQLPGEAEQRRARERLRHGIPVDRKTVAGLRELAIELGVPWSLEPCQWRTTEE